MKRYSFQMLAALMVVFVALSFVLWLSCDRTPKSPVAPVEQQEGITLNKANPMVQTVMAIQNNHTPRLMDIPGVVGTGTGLTDDGQLAIKVFTVKPGVEGIPKHLDGVPVVVKVTGMFVAYSDPTARFDRPVPIGVSTGHPDITAGTIGCRVKDGSGNVFALSNNHVYANSNNASIGDNELQPGPYDGGQDPADAIGTLHDFEPIKFDGSNNYIDAAIASTNTSMVGYATPSDGYGTPSATTVSASVGLKVQKFGRTTHWTHGEVAELNVTVDVCYETQGPFRCVKLARFVDQFTITPGSFSDGGDSGSLIVTDDSNKKPVGLLFAGSSDRTIANPINYVLNRFNVTIDDGSGGGNIAPTADFTYTTSDLTASFTDQSSDPDGSIVAWSWNFGDGSTSTAQNPSHTYAAAGTYTVSLTVTDNDGATDATSKNVTVSSGSTNNPPTADFTFTTADLTANFTDQSTDSDGSIVGWNWDFGDGSSSTAQNPSHTYAAAGTYSVSLTVTDNEGATDATTKDVTVSTGGGGDGITLTATGYKIRGRQHADLEWSGAVGDFVDVYRDGVKITTTENDGFYTDNIGNVGGGSYTYQIFDGTTWSNQATVTF